MRSSSPAQLTRKRVRMFALATTALLAAGGCSTVSGLGERVSSLWPFGGDGAAETARPEDGRIAISAAEAGLEVDPALAVMPVVLPATRAQADWPFAGGNAANAPQHLAGNGEPGLQIVWRRGVVPGSASRRALIAPPIVADGKVFLFGTDLVVHAVDAATGRPEWRQSVATRTSTTSWLRPDVPAMAGGLAYANGRVFAAQGAGEVVSLDAATGDIGWRVRTQTPLHSSPTVADGKLYVTSYDSEIYAIDVVNGTISWTSSAIPEPARMLTSPSPAVVGDTVIAPFASGEVIALMAGNGRRLWLDGLTRGGAATSLATINDIASRPVVVDGVVYAASQSGVLAAIDLRTGTRLWDLPLGSIQMPWVAGDYIFAVSTEAQLVCIDRRTGRVRWLQQLDRYNEPAKRKGRISWTGPVLVDGQLILASSRGQVITVNPADGVEMSRLDIREPVFLQPAVAGGTVYLLTDRGTVVALR
jgi:outer membrane protein assembly factor BamB